MPSPNLLNFGPVVHALLRSDQMLEALKIGRENVLNHQQLNGPKRSCDETRRIWCLLPEL